MYRIITLLVILLLPFASQAQKTPSIVRGTVYDTISKKGLAYATVSIVNAKDSTLVSFARADSSGKFKLNGLDKGQYLLSASYVGYVPVWRSIEIIEGMELNVGNVDMTDVLHAGDVMVTAKRPPVTINNDTVEFNTENFKTQPNAVVEDMLKKLPGVTVDNDGTVRMNGQRINRVLVNGREFFTGDPRMATKNLEADAVDKVQVFDKKSDRAEFTGVDDGQSEKTLNLKLKKDRNNALFGRVTAGAGDKERYEGQTNMNRFNGDQQMSLIAMANNTNKQGFSISDVMNFTGEMARGMRNGGGITIRTGGGEDNGLPVSGGPGQPGIATTIAGGVNYNDLWNSKRTDFNTNVMGSHVDLLTDRATTRQNLLPGSEFTDNSISSTSRKGNQQRWNMIYDHKIDSFSSIRFTPQLTLQQIDQYSTSRFFTETPGNVRISDGMTNNQTRSDAFNFNGNALFRHRFAKKGRTISSTLSMAYNDSKQDGQLYTLNTTYLGGMPVKDSIANQKNNREAVTRSLGGNVVYTEPIGKRSLLEFSGFYNTSVGDSKRTTYDSSGFGKFETLNTRLSNDFKSEYSYGGGGLNFRTNLKKMSMTFGTNLQSATLVSTNKTNGSVIRQSFTDFLPAANIQYRMNQTRTLNFNYSTSTTQPSTSQLQPVAEISDPRNVYIGNPNLKRSYSQSVNLNYFSTNIYTQRNFFAFIAFNKIDNAIVNSDLVALGVRHTMPVNVNGNYVVFANVNAGFPIRKLKSRIDVGLGSNLIHNNGFLNGNKNTIDNRSISPNLSYGFALDGKLDIIASGRWNISSAKYSLQPMLNSNYMQQVYGFEMTNYIPGGVVLNNSMNYTINTGRADGYNTKIALWNASVAKSFLKNKRGEVKFSVLDILNQNKGVSRNASTNYIEDTRYNVLNRYFLLSFTFGLNKAGRTAGPQVMIRSIGG
jgi:hypothetical protein